MADDPDAILRELWVSLAHTLRDILRHPGETKAFYLQVARQFLADNGVSVATFTSPQDGADHLKDLLAQMPDFDGDGE